MSAHYKKKRQASTRDLHCEKWPEKISTRKKKKDEPLHCARLGNVCIRSSTSISLKETGSVCVWQKRAGLTTTGRTQRGQFWVSGIGLVPLQWRWFLVRSSFLPTLADDWHRQPPQCYQRHDSNLAADLLRANQQTQTNDFRPTPRLPHKWISNLSFWRRVMVASDAYTSISP